jgi:FPC/CPF motif-containing protein YcgG
MLLPSDQDAHPLARCLRELLQDPAFPCVGAKSALAQGTLKLMVARDITSGWDDLRIYPALLAFASSYKGNPGTFRSFAVLFEGPTTLSEVEFEHHLWARLQSLSDKDAWLGFPYDERVQAHPEDNRFSLSFGGEAFFVVGLHPNASRKARRFEVPMLVFNLHHQFEQLRAEGRYGSMRDRIRERDLRYSGSINPMVATYGDSSEARQYSGREVDDAWVCPFRPREHESGAP